MLDMSVEDRLQNLIITEKRKGGVVWCVKPRKKKNIRKCWLGGTGVEEAVELIQDTNKKKKKTKHPAHNREPQSNSILNMMEWMWIKL